MMKYCQKINLQEPQRIRNATANFVNLIMTSTVTVSVSVKLVCSVESAFTVNELNQTDTVVFRLLSAFLHVSIQENLITRIYLH